MALGEEGKQEADQLTAYFMVLLCEDQFSNRIQTPVSGPGKQLAASTVTELQRSQEMCHPTVIPLGPTLEPLVSLQRSMLQFRVAAGVRY